MKRTKFLIILVAIVVTFTSAFSFSACFFGFNDSELRAAFANYTDRSRWNFADTVTVSYNGESSADYYEYSGNNILNTYTENNVVHNDYLVYGSGRYYFYYDNGNGTYDVYNENSDQFAECYSYMRTIDLSSISLFRFTKTGDGYVAKMPSIAGSVILGEYTGYSWVSLSLSVADGYITEIVGVMSDGYTYRHELGKYGQVRFTLPDTNATVKPTGTMEKQIYDEATFDYNRLQDKLTNTGKYPDPAIGLPSTDDVTALVIPVKFSNTTISQTELNNLNIAFNGTSEETGWESVKTYYQKASYGQLNLSFDIVGVGDMQQVGYYSSSKSSSYYSNHTVTSQGQKYNDGDNVLLHEALAYYENKLDLTKYDTNGDGVIDAVYLIYSAPVDYKSDSFYWAYVTWDDDNAAKAYDGLDAYYYLFAGFGFMKESVKGGYTNASYPVISGLKVNASTYIHETGHLLGLDDYYDYYPTKGCNEGLGGADMMDYTVGDQNVYSKTMLGWLTPTIVTSTQTVTIQSSQAKGDAILIPLNFNNSYFCEYLLIDLYSAQGLNKLHASVNNSYLYGGAAYGVRIYHVSSWIENAYDNDFGSFTDYNNSMSEIALIKLVEADGERKFASSNGNASASDLWKSGDTLSSVYPQYVTNDRKLLIFDISIDSVSAAQATITITYQP